MLRQDVPIKMTVCRRAAQMKIPVSGAFELTPRCSLNCKMCYIRMTDAEMRALGAERTPEQWLALAGQAKDAGTVFLLLTGGEPLVYPEFRKLYSALCGLGFSIDINTNGTLIDAEYASFFRELPPARFNVTLYGASRETYAALCGDGGAYDRTVRAIDALTDAGLLVSLNATLTPENARDTEKIAEFARERDLNLKLTSVVVPPARRGKKEEPHRLSAEDAGKAAALGHFRYFGKEQIAKRLSAADGGLTDFLLPDGCVPPEETGTRCLAGNSQFWVAWNGEMYPCCMMPWICEKPFEAGFEAAWKRLSAACDAVPQTPQCGSCALSMLCPSCAALQHAETDGNPLLRPDYLCRLTETYLKTLRALCGSVCPE